MSRVVRRRPSMPVRSEKAIQISGTSTPSRSRVTMDCSMTPRLPSSRRPVQGLHNAGAVSMLSPMTLFASLPFLPWRAAALVLALTATRSLAGDAAEARGEPVLEAPTLHSLGVHWIIAGDENANAAVRVEWRKTGDAAWREGPPLFRVERGAHRDEKGRSSVDVPEDAWLFAGSVVLLEVDTNYDLRLTLADPDGGERQPAILKARTSAEPAAPRDAV